MKNAIKDYFTFSSRERIGMLVLLVLVILAIAFNFLLRYFPFYQKEYDYSGYDSEIKGFRNSLCSSVVVPEDSIEDLGKEAYQLFPFDPNTATESELESLGVEDRIAGRILAYRKKGGRFWKKEDLLKIYGFDRILFATLVPYINIRTPYNPVSIIRHHTEKEFPSVDRIEINASDTSALKKLKGIGPVLASRIIKYRALLGGYYSIDQLTEVYGISDSLFLVIKDKVRVDTLQVRRISINEANEVQLSRHPYIGKYAAKAIISYRNSFGSISSVEELVNRNIIPEEFENRIKAYLSFP